MVLLLRIPIETLIIENGTIITNKEGCRQGSIVSPILANIYLHYVIDSLFPKISKENLIGQTGMMSYCGDMVFVFENENRCKKVL
ncbi:reverse transcriptase [Orientia tsutsugamushi str. Gilliam]|uniref:Reverse transcriptase n=1 Tax=Orientia tsutsugamushi str. Gilliam TaxID=1359184 RepID=A0A2U3RDB2_ORITS|nr:reverse transcriptase [Orientia tsutsugamushi str. Gilliam]